MKQICFASFSLFVLLPDHIIADDHLELWCDIPTNNLGFILIYFSMLSLVQSIFFSFGLFFAMFHSNLIFHILIKLFELGASHERSGDVPFMWFVVVLDIGAKAIVNLVKGICLNHSDLYVYAYIESRFGRKIIQKKSI